MLQSLDTFYRSKEWRRLLDVLKIERQDEDGNIICAYCGKPIVKAYDIIGHHKEHLTEENVNDISVSLNPDNVEFVHHRCHNYIHNKLGYPVQQVFLVYGAPLSGKSTYVQNNKNTNDLVIDIDNIWQCITNNINKYYKPAALKPIVFRLRDDLIDAVKYRLGRWSNAYIIGGYPLSSERERICRELGAREVFIECSKDECLHRLYESDDGRDREEWTRFIESWFERYTLPCEM